MASGQHQNDVEVSGGGESKVYVYDASGNLIATATAVAEKSEDGEPTVKLALRYE